MNKKQKKTLERILIAVALVILRSEERRVGKECRSEEHTSELQSPITISYAVFCLKKLQQQE